MAENKAALSRFMDEWNAMLRPSDGDCEIPRENEKTQGPFEYYMISTTDQDGQPGPGGGIIERQHPQHQIINYSAVSSNDETAAKVQQFGGQIVVAKTEVPDTRFFVACIDTENNAFVLWESA